ncbi:MAG: phosphoribosylpyrophosphate synthetase [Aequorivita sp.]
MKDKTSNDNIGIMTTLSEVIDHLKEKGYTTDFNLKPNYLGYEGNSQKLFPEEFIVDKHYRFEGESNPDDEAIVFAISSPKYNLKGVLINGYGISSESITDEMIKALDERKK